MLAKKHPVRVMDFRLASFLPFRLVAVSDSVYRVFAEHYEGSLNLTIPEIRRSERHRGIRHAFANRRRAARIDG